MRKITSDPVSKPVRTKPEKPDGCPLFPHDSGRWARKIKGKLRYFGRWEDLKGALALHDAEFEEWNAGRVPHRGPVTEYFVRDMANEFLTAKTDAAERGDITSKTLSDYHTTCARMVKSLGRLRAVSDLKPDDFAKLRNLFAETLGAVALSNEIQRTRTVFTWAMKNGKIDRLPAFGDEFKKPPKRTILLQRAQNRAEHGLRMLSRDEILAVLKIANPQMKAMILLAANGGLGAADIATLPITAIDLQAGWFSYPRAKTGVDRRFPLWPETVAAVKVAIAEGVAPVNLADAGLAFLTCFGHRWVEVKPGSKVPHDSLGPEFAKLLRKSGVKRHGVRFYGLRHGFQSIGDETLDFVAVRAIMGHSDGSMSANYREQPSDIRLRAVVDHVRTWLFGSPVKKPTKRAANSSAN